MSFSQANNRSHSNLEILDQHTVYQGHIQLVKYSLRHQLYSGEWSKILTREVLVNRRAVGVILYDPQRDEVVLIEEFRAGAITSDASPWLIGTVAGLVESGEMPEQVAKREAMEEANCPILELLPITEYWVSPSISAEKISLFCGRVDATHVGGIFGLADEGEDIKVHVSPRATAYQAVVNGQINNAISIIALQWLELNYAKVQQMWLSV